MNSTIHQTANCQDTICLTRGVHPTPESSYKISKCMILRIFHLPIINPFGRIIVP